MKSVSGKILNLNEISFGAGDRSGVGKSMAVLRKISIFQGHKKYFIIGVYFHRNP